MTSDRLPRPVADPAPRAGPCAGFHRPVGGFCLALLLVGGRVAACQAPGGDSTPSLGTVDFRVSCSPAAQAEFNHAVALLHHMTYTQARAAFQRVSAIDPRCAMASWGVAMTLFQPLWPTRPAPAELQQGWEAVQRASMLGPATDRERRYVAAAEAFFVEPASPDYWLRIGRWERATERVYLAYPDDPEAAAFYALALLAAAPTDSMLQTRSSRAAEILLALYQRNPEHPGAMHYLIHANDVTGRERQSLDITRKYESLAPGNPHALHMPTHIYTRLGDWEGVIRGNLRAADAALAYPAGSAGEFVSDEFPHAIEYLVYAELQRGADGEAARQIQRLLGTPRLQPTFKTAFHLASTAARYALERGAWNEAAQLAPREPASLDWDRFAWPEAITHFARGLGAAHLGDQAEASAASARLGALAAATRRTGEELFARNIEVLRLELDAWRAEVDGQGDSAVSLLRSAAALEGATPKHAVTPGPTLPADELLGDLLMEQRRPVLALASYQRSLDHYPRRFNSLLGAARAAREAGDTAQARSRYRILLQVADSTSLRPALEEARNYLGE